MKILVTATDQVTQIEGVPVRLWEGITDAGVKCKVFIHRIAVHNSENANQFERELKEQLPPARAIDLRHIL